MLIKIKDYSVILDNLKKILVAFSLYCIIWLIIILNYFVTYSENFFNQNQISLKTIGFSVVHSYMGENFLADRLAITAQKIGIRSYVIRYPRVMNAIIMYNAPIILADLFLYIMYKPDYTLSVDVHSKHSPFGKKFVFLNIPFSWFKQTNNEFIKDYDAYIDINRFGSDALLYDNFLKKINNGEKKKIIASAVPVQEYKYHPCTPKKLIIFGGRSGSGRSSKEYDEFFKKLADAGYSYFYGPGYVWEDFGIVYKGLLKNESDLINVINDGCIGLAIHSHDHIKAGIPTTRVMEIAAASANIISDKNPFVEKYFGDSVLYFDHTLSSEEMFRQVDEHVRYLINNPEKARKIAKKSHDIFINNFTTEKFLLEIDKNLLH